MKRGRLRIYLGAVAGVGKTYAMLGEAWRRKQRGQDIVIGFVETHGRAETAEQMRDLEVVPRRRLRHRGATFEEMDVDAVLARRPEIALVDELAHSNVPGSRNAKRWQDVSELLDAGIDVISTLNIQHLESLNDVVERITGVPQRETIPDLVVRAADELQLVEMAPEALRRRLAHGDIYPADKIDAALANFFRPGNLGALRELALLWLADRVDEDLHDYLVAHGIDQPWETRERVLVGLSGAPGGEAAIRRAARMAMRTKADLIGVHVITQDGLGGPGTAALPTQRTLLENLGGHYHEVTGDDVSQALLQMARAEQTTQLVLGASRRSRWAELTRGSVVNQVIRGSGPIDVHVISPLIPQDGQPLPTGPRLAALPARRRLLGAAVALAGLPLLTGVLRAAGAEADLATALLSYLALIGLVATLGGIWPSFAVALASFAAANWFFTPPFRTWTIDRVQDVLALSVFLATAAVISALVDLNARRAAQAHRAHAESTALARLAATVAGSDDPLSHLVDDLRRTFDLDAAAVLSRDGDNWILQACAGDPCPLTPEQGTDTLELDHDSVLVLKGRRTPADDRRILAAFAAQLALALDQRRLEADAARAEGLAQADRYRTALLSAVSHDLRTPLATIKAWLTGLLDDDVHFDPDTLHDILQEAVGEVDRLNNLVGNLLDMTRLQTGALQLNNQPTDVGATAAAALAALGRSSERVRIDISEHVPHALADPALLERILANLTDNALRHTPDGQTCTLRASSVEDTVEVRVIDRGPGIPPDQRDLIFQPFQRLDDHASGIGLGLAVARGLAEAISAELQVEDTPGGGATMVLRLKASP
jgi:two-component system sensor histidine kinase KdpD